MKVYKTSLERGFCGAAFAIREAVKRVDVP
jgi:hypothetical protein